MKAGWEKLPFDDAVADESGGNLKTPQSEFLDEGEFAVVDQGKELISGYVNDRTRLCSSPLPVVIFGDHTRCLKFVDFPFCMGADGIKVLRPKVNADVKYLYHYLRQLRLHDGGYDRHFKYLRRAEVLLPPLAEQQTIAAVLDQAEALRAKRRAALAQLDSLTQSLFLDIFGDIAKNDRNWPSDRMEDLMKIRRGGSPRPIENYLGGDINWIKIGDGTHGSDIYLERCTDKITRDGLKKTVFLKAGSLIFANCGVSLGFARILKIDGCIHDGWLSFEEIPESKLDKLFLLKALNSITEHFRRIAPSGTQPNLNTGLMKNFRMILPPIELQREFARRLTAVEKLKTAQRASLAELDALFASLQYRVFNGELFSEKERKALVA